MQHNDSRTAGRTSTLPRRLATAKRSFCHHVRSVLQAQACVILFTGEAAGGRDEGRAVLCRDGIPATEARRLGMAPDDRTIGRLGFAQGLSGTFPVAGGILRIVALRGGGEPAFTEADARALDSMGGLAGSILDLAGTATELSALWKGSMQVLDRLTVGVVMIGAGGEVLASNRTARDMALTHSEAAHHDAEGAPGRPAQHHLLQTLSQSVRRSNGHTADAAAAFARLEGGQDSRISVLATPLARPNGDVQHPQPSTALFLSDTGRLFAPYQDWLCRLYGLTRLEAQLVTQIVEGRSLGDIAATLRVSIHTVRSYLKQIFGKTGVHRQAGLVKLVVGGIGQVRADHDAARPAQFRHNTHHRADAAQCPREHRPLLP
ncbi:helix-turn-helix transcriptional regulator [Azospirillum sp. sgz301742]